MVTTRTTVNPDFARLSDFIAQLPEVFSSSGEVLFNGRNEVRRIIAPDGTDLVVKRFGHLNRLRRLIYSTVSSSKAKRAYNFGQRFIELGFDTPTPVAYIEIYRGGLLDDAYFVSLYSDYTPLFGPLAKADRFDTALADRVADLMAELHEKGAVHGDPNLKNILYSYRDDGSVAISLIDTNRSIFRKRLSTGRCLKNLMRVTHRRDLMHHIVGRYAMQRGLDPVTTIEKVFALLSHFERNRAIRHKIKAIFKKQ